MSGQEISAAGQLRLMTAQHHAAQQQGSTQGTYQVFILYNMYVTEMYISVKYCFCVCE